MGAWNHGLMQDIKLLRIGCGYPPGAFGGDALRWRTTAVAQLIAAFEPNPLGPAIDAQGAVNEPATLYENFVYGLWQTALPELAACGYRLPGCAGFSGTALAPAGLRTAPVVGSTPPAEVASDASAQSPRMPRSRQPQAMTVRSGHWLRHRLTLASYTSRVACTGLGRTTRLSTSDKPYGAYMAQSGNARPNARVAPPVRRAAPSVRQAASCCYHNAKHRP